jgi:hypothetical protein
MIALASRTTLVRPQLVFLFYFFVDDFAISAQSLVVNSSAQFAIVRSLKIITDDRITTHSIYRNTNVTTLATDNIEHSFGNSVQHEFFTFIINVGHHVRFTIIGVNVVENIFLVSNFYRSATDASHIVNGSGFLPTDKFGNEYVTINIARHIFI